jgi:hypothetical protein
MPHYEVPSTAFNPSHVASTPPLCAICNNYRDFGNRSYFDEELAISPATLEESVASGKYCGIVRTVFDEIDIDFVKRVNLKNGSWGTEGITLHIHWGCTRLNVGKSHPTKDDLTVRDLMSKSFKALAAKNNKLKVGAQISMNKTAHDYIRLAA